VGQALTGYGFSMQNRIFDQAGFCPFLVMINPPVSGLRQIIINGNKLILKIFSTDNFQ